MKRFHLNLKVSDLNASTTFYTQLFGAKPAVKKEDYVKWMLDDPFINFVIEPARGKTGIAHVGIQAESMDELQDVYQQVEAAAGPRFEEGATECCYAASEKNWTRDPDGIIWEAFYTRGQITHYGHAPDIPGAEQPDTVCCMPRLGTH